MIAVAYEHVVSTKAPAEPTGPHKRIAYWVRAVLTATKLTQDEFAEKSKLSRAAITNYLAGKRRIRSDAMEKLRRVAPVELRDFDTWDGRQPNGAPTGVGVGVDPTSVHRVEGNAGEAEGYAVKTDEGRIIAKRLDALGDSERAKAFDRCIEALKPHPQKLDAQKTPGRAQRP